MGKGAAVSFISVNYLQYFLKYNFPLIQHKKGQSYIDILAAWYYLYFLQLYCLRWDLSHKYNGLRQDTLNAFNLVHQCINSLD